MTPVELKESPWFSEYRESYQASQATVFGLGGDIYGLTVDGLTQIQYLQQMSSRRSIIVTYNREAGFSFALETMRKAANDLLGKRAQPSGEDALLRSALGQSAPGDDWFVTPEKVIDGLRLLERLLCADVAERKGGETHPLSAFDRVAVIIEQTELICPDREKSAMSDEACDILSLLFRWGHDPKISRMRNPIFLCCAKPDEMHPDLRNANSGIKFIDIPLPTREDRRAYIQGYLERRAERGKPINLLDLTLDEVVAETAGINLRHIEDIFLRGYRDIPSGITHALIQRRKQQIITSEYSKIAEMLRPLPGGFESLGGMEKPIAWAQKKIIAPIRQGSRRAPKGVLLVGPPGGGKTLFAAALAEEIKFSALILKASNFLNKYVGETERNLAAFFRFARALAPVMIFVDEIDQGPMGRRGGAEDPVSGNIFNEMLTFMSDESLRGQVLVLFATNMPQNLDPALRRPGRIDAIYPFLLPNEEQRRSIFAVQAKSQGVGITDEAVLYAASDARSKDYSPADIMSIVAEAFDIMEENGHEFIGVEEISLALRYISPETPRTAKLYTERAIAACNNSRYLQQEEAALLSNRGVLEASIAADERVLAGGAYEREERPL